MIRLLVQSTRQKNRLALDSSDGHPLSSGQHISVKLGDFWIPGVIESDSEMYALIPDGSDWRGRMPLVAGMTIDDYTTLEENYPDRESEGEPVAINQNSNEAMEALYGPAAAHSEYSRFTTVKYRDAGREKQGMIMWITAATVDTPMLYVVSQKGFPDFVAQGDILDVVE